MGQHTPKVIILVLNWNGWRDTLDCLDSLYCSAYPDYQVVLIDNHSADDSLQRVHEWANGKMVADRDASTALFRQCPLPYLLYDRTTAEQGGRPREEESLYEKLPDGISHPLIIIQTGDNLGFAGGNNVGLRYVRRHAAAYVLLLNNDAMLPSRQTLSTLVGFMDAHTRAGACGGRLVYPDGSPQISYGNFPSLPRALAFLFPVYKLLPQTLFRNVKRSNVIPDMSVTEPIAVDYPSGACLMVRNETITDVGLLDERFFMYAEETDWCLRMMKRGWDRYVVPRADIVHRCAGSPGSSTAKINRYFLESLFSYYRKNFTVRHLWIVTAGYLLRSLCSWLYWSMAHRLASKAEHVSAQERARYWRRSLELAVAAIMDLISGEIGRERKQTLARGLS